MQRKLKVVRDKAPEGAGMGCRMGVKDADVRKLVHGMLSFTHAHVCGCESVQEGGGSHK